MKWKGMLLALALALGTGWVLGGAVSKPDGSSDGNVQAVPRSSVEDGYTVLDPDANLLKEAFNAESGKTRLLLYVAPTCGGCLRGADQIQKRLLKRVESRELAVYVVWAPKNGARQKHVDRVLRLVTDDRAQQFWDEGGAVVQAVDDLLELTGPCAGAFMVYGPDATWRGSAPPRPTYWEDAHTVDLGRDLALQFDVDRFRARVEEILDQR